MAVNIYYANAQELRTLEGVGEKKTAKIIKLRETDVTEESLAAEIQKQFNSGYIKTNCR